MKLPQIRQDRANHFIYGFTIYITSVIFVDEYIALGITLLIAILKEVYDKYKYNNYDVVDVLFTLLAPITLIVLQYFNVL